MRVVCSIELLSGCEEERPFRNSLAVFGRVGLSLLPFAWGEEQRPRCQSRSLDLTELSSNSPESVALRNFCNIVEPPRRSRVRRQRSSGSIFARRVRCPAGLDDVSTTCR